MVEMLRVGFLRVARPLVEQQRVALPLVERQRVARPLVEQQRVARPLAEQQRVARPLVEQQRVARPLVEQQQAALRHRVRMVAPHARPPTPACTGPTRVRQVHRYAPKRSHGILATPVVRAQAARTLPT